MGKSLSPLPKTTVAVDFDGVIHAMSEGWKDGSIYDSPVPGCREGLSRLASSHRLVVFTGRRDLPAVRSWLVENKLDHFFADVTYEKPLAVAYIDDRAIRFYDWQSLMEDFTV